ncbi:proton-coupled amino acid transporter-like protein CG1139 [Sitodiplosis mosellana]|uniref:proton-coupled amino acid transporter-like protein CG1139 n=1 Tax=Sitodiplosis mosellana TaxID=263140 RepID=UPI002443DB40|nr:proton-coupled amino acid transporter-like protein CG1139 [Sitodiplosis mosellana]
MTESKMNLDGYNNKTFVDDHGKRINIDNIQMSETSYNHPEKQSKHEEYDPYSQRTVKHPISNTDTIVHLLKGSLGTGILAMPKAIYHAGYITGTVGTFLIGMMCVYCVQMLLKSHYELCKRRKIPQMDYTTIAENAVLEGPKSISKYAPVVKHMANAFLLMCQIGGCCIYVVFIAANIKSIVDYATDTTTDVRLFMVIILLPIIFLNWIRNYKHLAPLSTLANIVTIVSFGIICYFIVREPISLEGKRAFGPASEFPFFFGTVLFSLEAIGVVIPLENEMKTPKSYVGLTGVLNRAFVIIVILYIGMGLFGYLKYGDAIRDSITLSLEINSKADEILAQSVKGMLAFGIYITHGIACYVAIDLTWNKYIVSKITNDRYKLFWEYVVRTVICLITFLLAVAIPKLDLFISLVGALCLSTLGLIFPALIETCVFWRDTCGVQRSLMVIKNILIACFGFFAVFVGTSTSVLAIYQSFTQ